MKNVFLIIVLLYSLNDSANAQEKYYSTYDFINSMLTNEIPLSFKDAVFATEMAYSENDIDVEDLYNEIDVLVRLVKVISNSDEPATKNRTLY